MMRIWMGVALLAWAGLAAAVSPAAVRKQMEASMLVNGEIEVDARGRVTHYTLDHGDKLPKNVVGFIDAHVAQWQFEPTMYEGQARAARNRMGLLLVATPHEDGNFRMELRSSSFYPIEEQGYGLESVAMEPPKFPMSAAEMGVTGTVYLVLRVGRDGRVEDVVAEQVNLRKAASEIEMKRWRGVFAKNAIAKARQWSFRWPVHGEFADGDGPWSVRVPVAYTLEGTETAFGRWEAYMPGPRQHAPWVAEEDGVSPETLAAGGLYPVGLAGGLRLVAPSFEG